MRIVPLRRDALAVGGPDAESFLQGQCSQDVAALGMGENRWALLLSPQGKLEALVRVTRTGEDAFVVDTDGGWGEAVAARLNRFKLRVKVDVTLLDWRSVAVRGAGPRPHAAGAELVLDYRWNGVAGFDVLGPDPVVELPVDDGRWEPERIAAGIPLMGAELDDSTISAEIDGLNQRCVSFTKGCYTGQELVARLDSRGNKVARHLRTLLLSAPAPAGTEIMADGAEVGSLTSSAGMVALGYVHRKVAPGDTVTVAGAPAEVRALPVG